MERTYLLWARFIGICGIVCVSFPVGKLHLLAPILLLAGIFFIIFLELRAIRKVHQARWDYERHILLDAAGKSSGSRRHTTRE